MGGTKEDDEMRIIINDWSWTHPIAYLSRSLGPGLVLKYWKSERKNCYGLVSVSILKAKDSRSTFDFQKVLSILKCFKSLVLGLVAKY